MPNNKELLEQIARLERENEQLVKAFPGFARSVIASTCIYVTANFRVVRSGSRARVPATVLARLACHQFAEELREGLKK